METNCIECLIGTLISFYLSNVKSLKKYNITAITYISRTICIIFSKGRSIKFHSPQ